MYSTTLPTPQDDEVALLGKLLQRANDVDILTMFGSSSSATQPEAADDERALLWKILTLAQ